jgi:hypothetical protein
VEREDRVFKLNFPAVRVIAHDWEEVGIRGSHRQQLSKYAPILFVMVDTTGYLSTILENQPTETLTGMGAMLRSHCDAKHWCQLRVFISPYSTGIF